MKALLTALALASVVTAAAAQAQNPPSTYCGLDAGQDRIRAA